MGDPKEGLTDSVIRHSMKAAFKKSDHEMLKWIQGVCHDRFAMSTAKVDAIKSALDLYLGKPMVAAGPSVERGTIKAIADD